MNATGRPRGTASFVVGARNSVPLLAALLLVFLSKTAVDAASCKDERNEDVDWFFMYKMPKEASRAAAVAFNKASTSARGGEEYFYVDARTPASTSRWPHSDHSVAEADGALANTLAPLYATNKSALNLAYATYNDQPPTSTDGARVDSHGHTKGVILFNEQQGAWLVHSVPEFPGSLHSGRYVFPDTGREYGQTALCVTFPTSQLDTIATHLRLQHPDIYDSYAPQSLLAAHPPLALLLQKSFIRTQPWLLTSKLTTQGNATFVSFAKHAHYEQDVYEAAVGVALRTDVLASTWRNGRGGKLPPACNGAGGPRVLDVLQMRFDQASSNASLAFDNTEDHSKWAVSLPAKKRAHDKERPESDDAGYVCVGSLNRMQSQLRRGGETLCFRNALLHGLLLNSVVSHDTCPRNTAAA
ncbi:deoxyribonuclease-2-alpha-like isoform X1 [Dermacentor variabilis]|uniref:deoxyribonuclease-2-alpha-like isoform X1 n=1 Tax=Dermacentor variabilis TaxID=34621 RepID=UPI003F5B09B5